MAEKKQTLVTTGTDSIIGCIGFLALIVGMSYIVLPTLGFIWNLESPGSEQNSPAPKRTCGNSSSYIYYNNETKFNKTNFYPGKVVVAFTTKTITYKEKVDGSPKKAPFTAFYLKLLPSDSELLKNKTILKKKSQISRNLQKLPETGYIQYSIFDNEDGNALKELMKSELSTELNSTKTGVNFFILTN